MNYFAPSLGASRLSMSDSLRQTREGKPFKDHFSTQASDYARFRPRYPVALFDWLASQSPRHDLVWDCACGNGQASVDLARHYQQVVATDASADQISAARVSDRVTYRVAPAEASGVPDAAASLVTVAQALHWFELDAFYAEVTRVLQPGGVLACWSYGRSTLDALALNEAFQEVYQGTLAPYWPPERAHVESGYRNLPFPFARIAAPAFELSATWSLAELLGYVRSWSSSARYLAQTGRDAATELSGLWGAIDPNTPVTIRWPLALLVGRV
jgi:SAM-dependent methyltransferase